MSTPMIPIDPEKRDDIYYRYKMPSIQTKVEGSGNGIKTVFPNIHDVCLAINRPEEILMKFFQSEMGAQRTVIENDDKFLIMGSHMEERVQEKVYDFIRKFVLCRHCRNPETQIQVEKNKKGVPSITLSCGACGKVMKLGDIDSRYVTALSTYFQKNPHAAKKKGAGTAEARSGDNAAAAAAAAAAETAKAEAVPTPPVQTVVQKSDLADTREPPQEILARFMQQHPNDMDQIISRSMGVMSEYNLDKKWGPLLVLSAIVIAEKEIIAGMRRYARLLRRFATLSDAVSSDAATDEAVKTELLNLEGQLQKATIDECARIFLRQKKADKLPVVLFALYIEGVLKSTSIEEWCKNEGPVSKVNAEALALMKASMEPLLKWFAG